VPWPARKLAIAGAHAARTSHIARRRTSAITIARHPPGREGYRTPGALLQTPRGCCRRAPTRDQRLADSARWARTTCLPTHGVIADVWCFDGRRGRSKPAHRQSRALPPLRPAFAVTSIDLPLRAAAAPAVDLVRDKRSAKTNSAGLAERICSRATCHSRGGAKKTCVSVDRSPSRSFASCMTHCFASTASLERLPLSSCALHVTSVCTKTHMNLAAQSRRSAVRVRPPWDLRKVDQRLSVVPTHRRRLYARLELRSLKCPSGAWSGLNSGMHAIDSRARICDDR